MRWLTRVRVWLRAIFRRSALEREMADEIQFHVDAFADDLVRRGVAPADARRRARIEFGSIESRKEDCRASLGVRLVDEFSADLRYAARSIRRSPGFAIVTIVTLALGIGANTAIFTLVDALVLRRAPVARPSELYQVLRAEGRKGRRSLDGGFTHPLWEELRRDQDVFSSMAAWGMRDFTLSRGGPVQRANGIFVSGDFFSTLEIAPALGRLITPADDHRGCPGIAVLSYGLWKARYGGAPNAIGSAITIDSRPFEIVGVTAPEFNGMDVERRFDVAVPNCTADILHAGESWLDDRSTWWLWAIGRLKPGVTPEQAAARIAALAPTVHAATLPQDWRGETRESFLKAAFYLETAQSGISETTRDAFQQPLGILMAIVGVVLVIACANVAALMLARASTQGREIAVRLSLGAGRFRVARQLLTYSLVLSISGALAGVLLAKWATALLVHGISTHRADIFLDVTPDWRIVGFTATVAVLSGLLFGMLPALRSTRVPLTTTSRTAAGDDLRSPIRKWIVAGQVALSLALLVTAGLFLRSFDRIVHKDIGFDRTNVLLVSVDLRPTSIPAARHLAVLADLQSAFASIPGVVSVAHSYIVPVSGGGWNNDVHAESPNTPEGVVASSLMNFVSPGYFATMRIPIVAGHDFTPADTETSPRVAVLNEAAAARFFPNVNPIGRWIRIDEHDGTHGPLITVVGVAANAAYRSLRAPMPPTTYFPRTQIPIPRPTETFALRAAVLPETLTSAVAAAAAKIGGDIPLELNTLERHVGDAMVRERLLAMLSAFFGGIALLLAMIGLYGSVSYRVAIRRTEFGIRAALGAPVRAILSLVMRDVAATVAVGIVVGIGLSLVAARAVEALLFGVGPRDVTTIAGASALLALVAGLAAYTPARRAARVDPAIALRAD